MDDDRTYMIVALIKLSQDFEMELKSNCVNKYQMPII